MADPLPNFHFQVEIDGIARSSFSEVELPETEVAVVEYREGADFDVRKVPGLRKYGTLTLKRGVTGSTELFEWWKTVIDGKPSRRSVMVTLLDPQRDPIARWAMTGVWPIRYAVSPLVAMDCGTIVTETLQCAVDRFEAVTS